MRIHWKISSCLILLATSCQAVHSNITSSDITTVSTSTASTTNESAKTNDDISVSETINPKPVEIVKQIRKLNSDGSYTFGYEAQDGTFKIESRDVLGNVKGTFGFVDTNGEIKRVSYSANNNDTAFRDISKDEVVGAQSTRINKSSTISSTTRQPHTSLVYSHVATTPSPTRPTVIQAIPRRRFIVPTASARSDNPTTDNLRPIYGHYITSKQQSTTTDVPTTRTTKPLGLVYATSTPSTRPLVIIRPTTQVNSLKVSREGQIIRPDQFESTTAKATSEYQGNRRVLITRRPMETTPVAQPTTTKPVYEDISSEKDDEKLKKPVQGNSLRRQLHQDKDASYEAEQQLISYHQSSGDDSTDVYGSSITTGSPRPLFTTTASPPRQLHTVLAARQRQYSPQFTTQSSTSTIREYVRQPQRLLQDNKLDPTTESPSTTENYLTENPIPVLQIPANRNIPQGAFDDRQLYRQRPFPLSVSQFRTREYLRQNPEAAIPIGNQREHYRIPTALPTEDNVQYLRETSPPTVIRTTTPVPFSGGDTTTPVPGHLRNPIRRPIPIDDRDYITNRVSPYPSEYAAQSYGPPGYKQPLPYYGLDNPQFQGLIGAPVSTRDLQRLLQQLLIRHQRVQNYNQDNYNVNPYYTSPPPYGLQYTTPGAYALQPVQAEYRPVHQPIQRQPYYDPQNNNGPVTFDSQDRRQFGPIYRQIPIPSRQSYIDQQEMYSNPVPADPSNPYDGPSFVPRRRLSYRPMLYGPPYPQDEVGAYDQHPAYLPPEVREALLLRMLMLAINPENQVTSESKNDVTTMSSYMKKLPVRSVQILGEDEDTNPKSDRRLQD